MPFGYWRERATFGSGFERTNHGSSPDPSEASTSILRSISTARSWHSFFTTLHWLRLAVFAWILVALWQGLYVEAIVLALFTVLASGTISSMYPLYFEDAAKTGNRGAAEMLRDLRRVQSLLTPNDQS